MHNARLQCNGQNYRNDQRNCHNDDHHRLVLRHLLRQFLGPNLQIKRSDRIRSLADRHQNFKPIVRRKPMLLTIEFRQSIDSLPAHSVWV